MTTVSSSFDAADRITNTGYSYDALGRATAVPAADAQGVGADAAVTGNASIGYFANDMVASQTQGSPATTLSYTLDPAQNRGTPSR